MTKRQQPSRDEVRASMRQFANQQRDIADEAARMFDGCDDPQHPWSMFDEDGKQRFTSWVDFVERVARPLVEAEGDEEAVQKAMALYRTQSPYYICVALVMALNRINDVNPYPPTKSTPTKERGILERLVAELHDASQVSGGNNMIRSDYLLEIIGDAVECPDCRVFEKERQEEQIDKDIIEVTKRVAEREAEEALDERLRRRPHERPE